VIIKVTICKLDLILVFLSEMLSNLNSSEVLIEMSLPNRAGILTPIDGTDEGEKITMLVMPVMLNN